jgi:hypothetical protein
MGDLETNEFMPGRVDSSRLKSLASFCHEFGLHQTILKTTRGGLCVDRLVLIVESDRIGWHAGHGG